MNPHNPVHCPFCAIPLFSFSKYSRHLELCHEYDNNFRVKCHVSACNKTFSKVSNYRKHNTRNHGSKLFFSDTQNPQVTVPSRPELTREEPGCSNMILDLSNDPQVSMEKEVNDETFKEDFKKHFTKFVLNIKEKHLLPDTVQTSLTSELKFFVNYTADTYKTLLRKGLLEAGIPHAQSQTLSGLLAEGTMFDQVANQLDTKAKLKSYISSNFPFVAPVSYLLDPHDYLSVFHYIPIIDLLKQVLSRADVQEQLEKNQHFYHHSHVLYDTCDGDRINGCPTSHSVLKLQLYVDEFELCNPIGPKRGKYKLTGVYFTIGNLPKRHRNNNNQIFLCLLVRHRILKMHDPTYEKLFGPLLGDLETLNNGIDFEVNGVHKKIKAVIDLIIGDNLSSHDIAGFQTHFSSGRICRYCTITYSHFREILSISKLRERNNDVYDYQISFIDEDPNDALLYGLKHKCVFSKLSYFKVPDAFPADIMHDCLEGIIPVTIKLILTELHNAEMVSLDELNASLSQVILPTPDKPNLFPQNFFSQTSKIVGSAAQKLELFFLLPQIVDLSAVGDSAAWDVYLTMRECMDYVLSPVIEKDSLPYLADVIESYLLKFSGTFGAHHLIPKHHFLMHFPSLIYKFGPLRNFWCMHFEGKHQYFKRLIRNTRNFKNVTHTLTERHQMRLAHALASSKFIDDSTEPKTAIKTINVNDLEEDLRTALQDKVGNSLGITIDTTKSLKANGLLYEINPRICYILDCINYENIPCFAVLKHIFRVDKWYLCMKLYMPKRFVEVAHAYEVQYYQPWFIILPTELTDCHKHRLYRKNDQTFAFTTFNVTKFNKDL